MSITDEINPLKRSPPHPRRSLSAANLTTSSLKFTGGRVPASALRSGWGCTRARVATSRATRWDQSDVAPMIVISAPANPSIRLAVLHREALVSWVRASCQTAEFKVNRLWSHALSGQRRATQHNRSSTRVHTQVHYKVNGTPVLHGQSHLKVDGGEGQRQKGRPTNNLSNHILTSDTWRVEVALEPQLAEKSLMLSNKRNMANIVTKMKKRR